MGKTKRETVELPGVAAWAIIQDGKVVSKAVFDASELRGIVCEGEHRGQVHIIETEVLRKLLKLAGLLQQSVVGETP